ncbi:MAG TPA: hypothetical protein VF811_02905 [Parasulfuritortus sp.]
MMKTLYILLLILGLPIGPGYWVYAKLYSGKLAMTLPLAPGEGGALVSPPFKLEPGMAPVGLVFHTQGSFVPRQDEDKPPKDEYTATLTGPGGAPQSVPFPLAAQAVANSNPVFNVPLLWMDKATAGEYRLEVRPTGQPVIRLEHPRLDVRANVQEPDGRIVSVGLLMMIAGFLGLFLG